jgi:DNA mismatch repair ATPase MutS
MKVHLLHRDHDFDAEQELPPHRQILTQDLELDTLLAAMACKDPFLLNVANTVLLSSLTDPEAIVYRQDVLRDCLAHPEVAREIYAISIEAIEARKGVFLGYSGASADTILHGSVRRLEALVEVLKRLRRIADRHADGFVSEGFRRFFSMLHDELDDAYLDSVDEHLRRLAFRDGVLISARLGRGNKGSGYTLRRPNQEPRSWIQRLSLAWDTSGYTFQIAERDEAGFRALTELRARGVHLVANALAQSTDHVMSFFSVLRCELGFYIACLNLHERLEAKGEPVCLPIPANASEAALSVRGLYDVCLSLSVRERLVGNDLAADDKALVMITGANQGGKSTLLRGIGLAHLMMQCGMFVAATAFCASVTTGIYTHNKREEDSTMTSGKLDEELRRMSEIGDHIRARGLLLCNESFSSTNEREGSEIARQIIRALVDGSVRVVFVTHLFDLARGFHGESRGDVLFLRAQREGDGRRTFKLVEGDPLPTSYGGDLYARIFGS